MGVEKLLTSSSLGPIPSPGTPKVKPKWRVVFSLTESKYCNQGLLSMAVTTCLTFELVVLKRGKSTLEEGMLFPWLIDWLTPPHPWFPPPRAAGYLPRMMASTIYCTVQRNARLPILQCVRCGLGEPFSSSQRTHWFASRRLSNCKTGIIQSRLFRLLKPVLVPKWALSICRQKSWMARLCFLFFLGDMSSDNLLAK